MTTVSSLIPQVTTNPSIRIHLLSLDFCYSAVIRVIYEVLNIEYEKEEGEEDNDETPDSHRCKLRQYCMNNRINYHLLWQYSPSIPSSSITPICDHFLYSILSSSDGISFTVLPIYQSLIIQEFIEVCFLSPSSFISIFLFYSYLHGNMLLVLFFHWILLFHLFMKLIQELFRITSLPRFARFYSLLFWIHLSIHLILYKLQILVLI